MTEISHRCWCACGGASNPRLYSRARYDRHGNFLGFTYHDVGSGQLVAKP